ncbi:MAG: 3-isopropylmalate dehydratase small subunit [Rhodospirillaceae bacterium]|nr:3-isopropylmalate dehydratase small subunit [Rhodospirillaceae bacterium]
MQPFTKLTARAAAIKIQNVDTDQILPARFLRKPRSAGYGNFLFHDLPDDPAFAEARQVGGENGVSILVADRNFGCGSSREGAVYALVDAGIRCVIAPSFGDIFASNASKNGLLTVVLEHDDIERLWQSLEASNASEPTVDLEAQQISVPGGVTISFEIDGFRKHRLLNGLDDIGLTMAFEADIVAHEDRMATGSDWISVSQ